MDLSKNNYGIVSASAADNFTPVLQGVRRPGYRGYHSAIPAGSPLRGAQVALSGRITADHLRSAARSVPLR